MSLRHALTALTLLALTGCHTVLGAQASPLSALAIAAAGTAPQLASASTAQQDAAAAAAGANDDSWTPPGLLNPFNDPVTAQADGTVAAPLPGAPVIPVVRFAEVNDTLYRGGLPSKVALQDLKAMGVKTDISLLGEVLVYDTYLVARERHWAKAVGINFVNIKVPTGTVPFESKPTAALADAFLKVVLDPANQPCYVHCVHGRDRTGTMVAVYRIAHDHYTNAQALAEMETFGFDPTAYPVLADFVMHYTPQTLPPTESPADASPVYTIPAASGAAAP